MKFHIGRLSQSGFVIFVLAYLVVVMTPMLLNFPIEIIMYLLIPFGLMFLVCIIGRLHDVGYEGQWAILVMITGGLGIIALAAPGKKEANKYGEVPPRSVSHLLHFWRSKKAVSTL